MQGGLSKIMTTLSELWKSFHLRSDPQALSEQERTFFLRFLSEEARLREQKRIEHLMRMSGIKRVKRLSDFDWTFNPKIPRDKIMEFLHTQWLKQPCHLVLIGPAGVGKPHIPTAICPDTILTGYQTVF